MCVIFAVTVLENVVMAGWMDAHFECHGVGIYAPFPVVAVGLLQLCTAVEIPVLVLLMSPGFELISSGGPNSPRHRVVVEHVDISWQ